MMENTNDKIFKSIEERINTCDKEGEFIKIGINKQELSVGKDRVAASFVCDNTFKECKMTNTVVETIKDGKTNKYVSSMNLDYEALITLIYGLRLQGEKVNNIYSVSIGRDRIYGVWVLDINSEYDYIAVKTTDKFSKILKTVLKDNSFRDKQHNKVKIWGLKIDELTDKEIIDILTNTVENNTTLVGIYTVTSDSGKVYRLVDSDNLCCLYSNGNILFVTFEESKVADAVIDDVRNYLCNIGVHYKSSVSDNIIMF